MNLFKGELDGLRVKLAGKWAKDQAATPEAAALSLQEYVGRSFCMANPQKTLFFGIVLARRIPLIRLPYRAVLLLIPPHTCRGERVRLVTALRRLGAETKAPAIAWGGESTLDRLTLYVQTGEEVRVYRAPTRADKGVRSVGAWQDRADDNLPRASER